MLVALVSAAALADDEPRSHYEVPNLAKHEELPARDLLVAQLAGQGESIAKATAIVGDKLKAADTTRIARLRAAYRVLHAPLPDDATDADRMTAARRRAIARLLVARDGAERDLLVEELDHLKAAAARTSKDAAAAPVIELPADLGWPVAHGQIARRFGTFEHERSKAMLSRRGIDMDVEDHAPAVASADGTVRYAGPIRGLDSGLVIDHGSFYTVVAKLGDSLPPVGAQVHKGDRLGRAARHRVYFEVRVKIGPGGIPVDPEQVLGPRHK